LRRGCVLINIWKFDGKLEKVMVGITNEEIIQDCNFPLEVMIPLMIIVKGRLVNSSFLRQERKRISARIVPFGKVRFAFFGSFAVSQVLYKTSTAFAIICKITMIASKAKKTSGQGIGQG
jgi:hypothetical protein